MICVFSSFLILSTDSAVDTILRFFVFRQMKTSVHGNIDLILHLFGKVSFIWSEYVQVILSIFGIENVFVVHQWWKQWIFFFDSVINFLLQERPQRKI